MSISNLVRKREAKRWILLILSFLILILISFYTSSLGVTNSTMSMVLDTIIKALNGKELAQAEKIIFSLRLPRTLLAILAGSGLAVAGSIMQGITGNPMVSPFTTGISSAAGFGASLAIVFGFSFFSNSNMGIISNAFLFALFASFLIFLLASRFGYKSHVIVLSGIAVNYLFQALATTVQFVADDAKLASVVNWSFGSINSATWLHCKIVLIVCIPSIIILMICNNKLSILSMNNDETATSMGVNTKILRLLVNILATLITASIISFTGIIGFVGLAAPHISRSLVGNIYKFLIPLSMIVGSILLLVSDTIGRLILAPVVIPVGIIISFIGVPIFLIQVLRKRGV